MKQTALMEQLDVVLERENGGLICGEYERRRRLIYNVAKTIKRQRRQTVG